MRRASGGRRRRSRQAVDSPELLLDRVQVEQRRRMLVLAVAGVDDVRTCVCATRFGAPICGCRITITGSYAPIVIAVSLSTHPLVHGRARRLERHRVGGEALRRELEARARRVDDSKNMITTKRPRSVGSFFTSLSRTHSKVRAVPSSRSTSSRVTSSIEIRCRFGGWRGGRKSSRITRMSAMDFLLFLQQQDAVDLVDLEQLNLDAFVARRRQVLADVVGADRKLAVAAVGQHR